MFNFSHEIFGILCWTFCIKGGKFTCLVAEYKDTVVNY